MGERLAVTEAVAAPTGKNQELEDKMPLGSPTNPTTEPRRLQVASSSSRQDVVKDAVPIVSPANAKNEPAPRRQDKELPRRPSEKAILTPQVSDNAIGDAAPHISIDDANSA